MRSIHISVVAGLAALGMAAGAPAALAQTTSASYLDSGVYHPADQPSLEKAQFIIGAQQYCWYPGGWRGPGFYWCGYAWRRGFGWGGPYGWNGWGGGYPAGWRGGYWRGTWYGVRGSGWRGPGWRGGGWNRGARIERQREIRRERRARPY